MDKLKKVLSGQEEEEDEERGIVTEVTVYGIYYLNFTKIHYLLSFVPLTSSLSVHILLEG